MNKKNILIISYSPLHRDPRILRQIHALKNDYNIQTIGYTNPCVEGVDFFEVSLTPVCDTFFKKCQKALKIIMHKYSNMLYKNLSINELYSYTYQTPDGIYANDWNGLYAAVLLKKKNNWNCKIYFDAHEYFPRYTERIVWKLFERPLILYALKKSKNEIFIMSTVCPSLARMYAKFFDFNKDFVQIITNSPDYEAGLIPISLDNKKRIQLIHHGGALRARNLEAMIDMMEYLPQDKYEMNFMLVESDRTYYEELIERAKKYPNIFFIKPVDVNEISRFINKFDIGIYILDNKDINHKYALPNKFFEFVQARLAIVVGDSSEMRNYINKYNLGVSANSNNPEELANEILKLSKQDIMRFKINSDKHAEVLSANNNVLQLKKIAEDITK